MHSCVIPGNTINVKIKKRVDSSFKVFFSRQTAEAMERLSLPFNKRKHRMAF